MTVDRETTSGNMAPPSKWKCPKCGSSLTTLVPTHVPWCAGVKHRRELTMMVQVGKKATND